MIFLSPEKIEIFLGEERIAGKIRKKNQKVLEYSLSELLAVE